MPITVVNRRLLPEREPNVIRFKIDRPSPLGCPFVIGVHGNRAEVLAKYQVWLSEIDMEDTQFRLLRRELDLIRKAHFDGWPVELVCQCAPQPCHGDIIKALIENEGEEAK